MEGNNGRGRGQTRPKHGPTNGRGGRRSDGHHAESAGRHGQSFAGRGRAGGRGNSRGGRENQRVSGHDGRGDGHRGNAGRHTTGREGKGAAKRGRDGSNEPMMQGHPAPQRGHDAMSQDVRNYWQKMFKLFRKSPAEFKIPNYESKLWTGVWTAAAASAALSISECAVLLCIYHSLPNTDQVYPGAEYVLQVSIRVLQEYPSIEGMLLMEKIVDIICNRVILRIRSVKNVEVVLELKPFNCLTTSLCHLMNNLSSSDMDRAHEIMKDFTKVKKYEDDLKKKKEDAKFPADDRSVGSAPVQPWTGWMEEPTMEWLLSGSWVHAPSLRNVYQSSDDYAETLLRMWVLLTFFWGGGAVWPKCRHKQGGGPEAKVCGEPLLTPQQAGPCRSQGCQHSGIWRCYRLNHEAVCTNCLRRHQLRLCGQPGSEASTDIYDGLVDRENVSGAGTVYSISHTKSRKPPKIEPNWKTAYRLNCSALVGIVKLAAEGEPLTSDKRVMWAEVVPMDPKVGSADEWKNRTCGKLAIRVLTRSDCDGLPAEAELPLETGARVAIVDMRVFVPEVISILATFANKTFPKELSCVPFINSLIGKHESREKEFLCWLKDNIRIENLYQVIGTAILNSNVKWLSALSSESRRELVEEIRTIPCVTTLSGTQLEAFACALFSDVHCTQGPPGTGKSYLGVCLVLAMDKVRRILKKTGVKTGPIVVLSYKNHALDEFLSDVLHAHKHLNRGELIRCGKSEVTELLNFSERKHPAEEKCQQELTRRVKMLRRVRVFALELWSCANYLQLTDSADSAWVPRGQTGTEAMMTFGQANVEYQPSTAALVNALMWLTLVGEKLQCCTLEIATSNDEDEDCIILPSPDNDVNILQIHDRAEGDQGIRQYFEPLSIKGPHVLQNLCDHNLSKWIKNLRELSDHWMRCLPREEQFVFILEQFLRGNRPPLRCSVITAPDGERCMESVDRENTIYCTRLHCCLAPNCGHKRVQDISEFCKQHRCKYDDACGNARYMSSRFCTDHICMGCLQTCKNRTKAAQPYACEDHKCQLGNCHDLVVLPHTFCEAHCCVKCLTDGIPSNSPICNVNAKLCSIHSCCVPNCTRAVYSAQGLKSCLYHKCFDCDTHSDLTCPDSHLCTNHKCLSRSCARRHIRNSKYCATHTCRICAEEGCFGDSPIEDRNCCFNHRLCNQILKTGRLCDERAVLPGLYCTSHNDIANEEILAGDEISSTTHQLDEGKGDGRCWGVKKKKGRCKAQGWHTGNRTWKFYCSDHNDQAPALPIDDFMPEEDVDLDIKEWIDHIGQSLVAMDEVSNDFVKSPCSEQGCIYFAYQPRAHGPWCCPLHVVVTPVPPPPPPTPAVVGSGMHSDQGSYERGTVDAEEETKKECMDRASNKRTSPSLRQYNEEDNAGVILAASEDDVEDASAYNAAADEQDSLYYPPDELEETVNTGQEHLRAIDVDGADSGAYGSDDSEYGDDQGESYDPPDTIEEFCSSAKAAHGFTLKLREWDWDMSLRDRLQSAGDVMKYVSSLLDELKSRCYPEVDTARQEYSQARAEAFSNAKIVGATVVGASRRLDAIRAATPFAIIVEEACEVMEPALMSVLAVPSVCKLELVGDHMQLPAFIQQCWYSLEITHKSIKTSLFERLVLGGCGMHDRRRGRESDRSVPIACTILDEQRRMRCEIADLTRPEYADLVEIIDHEKTETQRIGDVYLSQVAAGKKKDSFSRCRERWGGQGRLVPGAASCIFFWDISNNRESKPVAGLSACNEIEARAVTALCKWFQTVGVPDSCITVITPYKGQKSLITRCLREGKCIPSFNPGGRGGSGRGRGGGRGINVQAMQDSIFSSTVDRFQGDENDIVILSLVRVRSGNRFVALLNRFIVAASRARLGFYVVGSRDAVTSNDGRASGPKHWERFISDLECTMPPSKKSGHAGQGSSVGKCDYTQQRIGPAFPLCCPIHRESQKGASRPNDVPSTNSLPAWNIFCKTPCVHVMKRCGHECRLPCHIFQDNQHNTKCMEMVPRPCPQHGGYLVCHEIRCPNQETVDEALQSYECNVELPPFRHEMCSHFYSLSCHQYAQLRSRLREIPLCKVRTGPFHLPCGHILSDVECYSRQRFMKKIPPCVEKVRVLLECNHVIDVSCDDYTSKKYPNICQKDINISRPRCFHTLSIRCWMSQKMEQWWSDNNGLHAEKVLNTKHTLVRSGMKYGPDEIHCPGLAIPKCNAVTTCFQRSCGCRIKGIKCCDAFAYASNESTLSPCESEVLAKCPFCQNDIRIPCWAKRTLQHFVPYERHSEPLRDQNGIVVLSEEQAFARSNIDSLAMSVVTILQKACNSSVHILRNCSSGAESHKVKISCKDMMAVMLRKRELPRCDQFITKMLQCGHSIEVECSEQDNNTPCQARVDEDHVFPCKAHVKRMQTCVELLKIRRENPPCSELVDCTIFRCGHIIQARCSDKSMIEQPQPGRLSVGDVIECGLGYCRGNKKYELCDHAMSLRLLCGHEIHNVPCSDAFHFALNPELAPPCHAPVLCRYPICGHEIQVSCSGVPQRRGDDPDPRMATDEPCRVCLLRDWENAATVKANVAQFQSFMDRNFIRARDFLHNAFDPTTKMLECSHDWATHTHPNSRQQLIRRYADLLKSDKLDIELLTVPPPIGDSSADDLLPYTLVCTEVSEKEAFAITNTTYGRGIDLMDLTKRNILELCTPVGGQVHLAIGVVYRQRMLQSSPPFVLKLGEKGMERANLMAISHMERGYDCVHMLSGPDGRSEGKEGEDTEIGHVLYWNPGIAILLGTTSVMVQEVCSICLDLFKRDDGYMCSSKHFMCWPCFGNYVKSAMAPDAIKRSIDADGGNLRCTNPDCDECYSLARVAACSGPEAAAVFQLLLELTMNFTVDRKVTDAVEQERNMMIAEFQRIQAIEDAAERKANLIRLDVIDDILTLRCPRCRLAFLDFDGCFALTCNSATCACGFCAWCLTDCGNDAHSHVVTCPEGMYGNVYGSKDDFDGHHRERKRKKIENLLDRTAHDDNKVAKLAFKLLLPDLEHTGITLKPR